MSAHYGKIRRLFTRGRTIDKRAARWDREEAMRQFVERRKSDPSYKEWKADVARRLREGDVGEGYDAAQIRALFAGEPNTTFLGSSPLKEGDAT